MEKPLVLTGKYMKCLWWMSEGGVVNVLTFSTFYLLRQLENRGGGRFHRGFDPEPSLHYVGVI